LGIDGGSEELVGVGFLCGGVSEQSREDQDWNGEAHRF